MLGRLDGVGGIIRGNRRFVVSVTTVIHLVEGNIIVYERLETMGNGDAVEFLLRGVLLDGGDGPP